MKLGPQFAAAGGRRWSNSAWPLAITLVVALAIPLGAQTTRVFRDGNSWVEETTGSLPAGRELRAYTDLGSVQVQGSSSDVAYTIRKRTLADTEETARRQFEQLRFTASRMGDAGEPAHPRRSVAGELPVRATGVVALQGIGDRKVARNGVSRHVGGVNK